MSKYHFTTILFAFVLFLSACKKDDTRPIIIPDFSEEYKAGGETTIFTANSFAFSTPSPNLNTENLTAHLDGDAEFEK